MTLSASAIINGLTMFRAYNVETRVHLGVDSIAASGVLVVHPEDAARLAHEGWYFQDGPSDDGLSSVWRLEASE